MGGSSPGVGGITDGDAQKDSGKTGILLAAPEYFVSDRDLNSSDRATCKWCIFELIEISCLYMVRLPEFHLKLIEKNTWKNELGLLRPK